MTGAAALLWTLSRDLGLDGFRPPAATLAADYAGACRAGLPLACEISTGAVPRDARGTLQSAALAARAHEWCAQSDDVSCLVEAMLLVRDPFVGYGTDTPPEDQRAAWAKGPMVIQKTGDVGLYFVPPMQGRGFKVGDHSFSRSGDPDGGRDAREDEIRPLLERCRGLFRGFDAWRTDRVKACFYTVTGDERFVVEKTGVLECFGRSRALTAGNRWRILLLLIVVGLGQGVINFILQMIGQIGGVWLAVILTLAVSLFFIAFNAVLTAVGYYTLRSAKEGIIIDDIARVFD